MSKHIHVAVIVIVGMLLVFLAGLASSVLAGEDAGAGALGAPVQAAQDGPAASLGAVETSLTRMPLYFIENQGQLDEPVAYYVQGQDKTLYFTPQGVTFVLHGSAPPVVLSESAPSSLLSGSASSVILSGAKNLTSRRWTVKLDFIGGNPDVLPVGQDETGAVISYFTGRPEDWKTGLKTYSKIVYRDLWPGIDLQYSGTVNELKYQFVVQPGADPGHIQLAYRGASDVAINGSGQLEVSTPAGAFHDGTPYGYQEIDGQKLEVGVSYESLGVDGERHLYGFRVGAYDPGLPLVLDPVILVYCGFIGGSSQDVAYGIAVDSDGRAYVAGGTGSISTTFPVAVGPDLTFNGYGDAYVAKVKADGTGLDYCGYIGGSEFDGLFAIAVDALGQAYVAGYTGSSQSEGFPVIGGPDLSYNGGDYDTFVAKLSATGKSLVYCGYIGGSGTDRVRGIAVDSEGSAYVTGDTEYSLRPPFPVTAGPDLIYNGGDTDAFVAKVNADGTALVYCGYIGGSGTDTAEGIAVDTAGQAYVTGATTSTETMGFPVTVGPDLTHNGGQYDTFVAKVLADGTALEYCGYIGGTGYDDGRGISVDSSGHVFVVGDTKSSETDGFPVTVGPDLTYNDTAGRPDVFVAKVTMDGRGLSYCGYIGGGTGEHGTGIAVDRSGCAHVVGYTHSDESEGFPVTVGPDLTYNGDFDAFVAKVLSDGRGLSYCGYIGGSGDERGEAIAMDPWGAAYVSGWEWSTDGAGFPVTTGPDLTHNGQGDAFVAKVEWNYAPLLGDVLPSSGSGPAGVTEYFRTTWSDANGRLDLKQCYFHIGSTPTLAGNVTLLYHARKNKLWMLADDGTTWTGGHAPGTATALENSQATVFCDLTTVGGSGDTLSVTWAIQFKPGYTGPKKTGLMCKDIHKAKAKGAWKGRWTITP